MNQKDQKISLADQLIKYGNSDFVPFHMPGHKRKVFDKQVEGIFPLNIDITEIEGFDNLHHPEGILRDSMEYASEFYETKNSIFCVNGSTGGILSAIFAVLKPGETLLMGRNCHKSVYHAVLLRELKPVYLYPQIDEKTGISCGYDPEEIKKKLKSNPDIKAALITSPTYEGIVSDISAISEICHKVGVPLIVDEAHGAHFPLHQKMQDSSRSDLWFPESYVCATDQIEHSESVACIKQIEQSANIDRVYQVEKKDLDLPVSAIYQGADVIIQSLHKTLPAMTQTAIVHVNGDLVDPEQVRKMMGVFQTSSPSYVLMSSIDTCIRFLGEKGVDFYGKYLKRLWSFRNAVSAKPGFVLEENSISGQWIKDPSKLILRCTFLSGKQLYDVLINRFHIQPEMCTSSYVLLMTSMMDTDEMYERLLESLDRIWESRGDYCTGSITFSGNVVKMSEPEMVFIPAKADIMQTEKIALTESTDRISAEYAYQYPPGIPLLVPGERINEEILSRLMHEAEIGLQIEGLQDMTGNTISVIKE